MGAGAAERFARLPPWLKSAIRRVVEALPLREKKMTICFLLKRFRQGAALNGIKRRRQWVSNITPTLLRQLGVAPIDLGSDAADRDLLDRAQQWDLETLLAEGLLTKSDRASMSRSEEHTSELQSPDHLVCRLLLEKTNKCHCT